MENPTSDTQPQAPAWLLRYDPPWADDLGHHATLSDELPADAIAYGCTQTVHGTTELEMRQEAVRNRIRVQAWEARRALAELLIGRPDDQSQPAADDA
ncbi:hypothetical protein MF672_038635 [Actinomadura sp. ATCC 31491]|uniref:Uncharacterized protein n=1 Tax=Actinomadura luzonensis TaxID=2805427 RepID=A0ABT0G4Y7_9ACTN|nr:hypothetical protein [Actinomadura luzonensis]MCK2219671.1 hypothetical protein [Actinomadura luzonensis]